MMKSKPLKHLYHRYIEPNEFETDLARFAEDLETQGFITILQDRFHMLDKLLSNEHRKEFFKIVHKHTKKRGRK